MPRRGVARFIDDAADDSEDSEDDNQVSDAATSRANSVDGG